MITISNTVCCGMKEISGLSFNKSGLKETLRSIYNHRTYYDSAPVRGAVYLFTQASGRKNPPLRTAYGMRLAKFIRSKHLGSVVSTRPAMNRNSGNYIRTFAWTPDWTAFNRWYKKGLTKRRK